MKQAKILLIVFLFAMLIVPSYALAKDNVKIAKVLEFSGSVEVKKGGGEKKFKVFKNMGLTQGDMIITGRNGKVTIELDKDKEVVIGSDTKLVISELVSSIKAESGKTSLNLLGGKVMVNVKEKLKGDSKFEIKTPTSIMGVRGTQFFVMHVGNQTQVGVFEGEVLVAAFRYVTNDDGTVTVKKVEASVVAGEQTIIDNQTAIVGDFIKEEIQPEEVDLFILEELIRSPDRIDPKFLENIDALIEQKREEQSKQEEVQQQENSTVIIYDEQTPGNGDIGGWTPPVPNPGNGGQDPQTENMTVIYKMGSYNDLEITTSLDGTITSIYRVVEINGNISEFGLAEYDEFIVNGNKITLFYEGFLEYFYDNTENDPVKLMLQYNSNNETKTSYVTIVFEPIQLLSTQILPDWKTVEFTFDSDFRGIDSESIYELRYKLYHSQKNNVFLPIESVNDINEINVSGSKLTISFEKQFIGNENRFLFDPDFFMREIVTETVSGTGTTVPFSLHVSDINDDVIFMLGMSIPQIGPTFYYKGCTDNGCQNTTYLQDVYEISNDSNEYSKVFLSESFLENINTDYEYIQLFLSYNNVDYHLFNIQLTDNTLKIENVETIKDVGRNEYTIRIFFNKYIESNIGDVYNLPSYMMHSDDGMIFHPLVSGKGYNLINNVYVYDNILEFTLQNNILIGNSNYYRIAGGTLKDSVSGIVQEDPLYTTKPAKGEDEDFRISYNLNWRGTDVDGYDFYFVPNAYSTLKGIKVVFEDSDSDSSSYKESITVPQRILDDYQYMFDEIEWKVVIDSYEVKYWITESQKDSFDRLKLEFDFRNEFEEKEVRTLYISKFDIIDFEPPSLNGVDYNDDTNKVTFNFSHSVKRNFSDNLEEWGSRIYLSQDEQIYVPLFMFNPISSIEDTPDNKITFTLTKPLTGARVSFLIQEGSFRRVEGGLEVKPVNPLILSEGINIDGTYPDPLTLDNLEYLHSSDIYFYVRDYEGFASLHAIGKKNGTVQTSFPVDLNYQEYLEENEERGFYHISRPFVWLHSYIVKGLDQVEVIADIGEGTYSIFNVSLPAVGTEPLSVTATITDGEYKEITLDFSSGGSEAQLEWYLKSGYSYLTFFDQIWLTRNGKIKTRLVDEIDYGKPYLLSGSTLTFALKNPLYGDKNQIFIDPSTFTDAVDKNVIYGGATTDLITGMDIPAEDEYIELEYDSYFANGLYIYLLENHGEINTVNIIDGQEAVPLDYELDDYFNVIYVTRNTMNNWFNRAVDYTNRYISIRFDDGTEVIIRVRLP